jgi:hypothetical protein
MVLIDICNSPMSTGLDIDLIVAIPNDDDSSNQCDSRDDSDANDEETVEDKDKQEPLHLPEVGKTSGNNSSGSSPRSRLTNWTASRIPAPSVRSLSRSSFTSELSAQKKLQTPEKASKSVARLQQFRQQVPANAHGRHFE